MQALGIDIGGTGIKGAVVDTATGQFTTDRLRIKTPHPATPDAVAAGGGPDHRALLVDGPIGATFPGVVKGGTHPHRGQRRSRPGSGSTPPACSPRPPACPWPWSTTPTRPARPRPASVTRRRRIGVVVLMLTLGTGIGSALVLDGG